NQRTCFRHTYLLLVLIGIGCSWESGPPAGTALLAAYSVVMRVLISGAGIAGPTLAYWLLHYGFEPTIVERAPSLRTGGYFIDFWGTGFEIAERMGLVPELLELGYKVREVMDRLDPQSPHLLRAIRVNFNAVAMDAYVTQ